MRDNEEQCVIVMMMIACGGRKAVRVVIFEAYEEQGRPQTLYVSRIPVAPWPRHSMGAAGGEARVQNEGDRGAGEAAGRAE